MVNFYNMNKMKVIYYKLNKYTIVSRADIDSLIVRYTGTYMYTISAGQIVRFIFPVRVRRGNQCLQLDGTVDSGTPTYTRLTILLLV